MILSFLQLINFFDAQMRNSIVPYMAALSFIIVPLVRSSMSKKKIGLAFNIPLIKNYLDGEVGFITSW